MTSRERVIETINHRAPEESAGGSWAARASL